jgi:hypothetical protein
MKQILYSFFILAFGASMIACEEQGKFGLDESEKAFNLRLAPDKGSFDISQGDPSINFTMYSDNKNIETITILVELLQFGEEEPTRRAILKEIPGNLFSDAASTVVPIKLSEFVGAVGLTLDDLAGGDIFTIYNQVNLNDGRVYPDTLEFDGEEFVNVENSFFTAAGSTSFTGTLSFPVLCPFVASEAAGTYSITRDDFEIALDPEHQPEVIAGPGANQVTYVDMLAHGYDVVVDVDPVTDVATVKKQLAWDPGNYGLPYPGGFVEGEGFYFSCTGFLTLDLEHTVSAGTYGTFRIEFTKNP